MDNAEALRAAASLLASLARLAAIVTASVVLTRAAWDGGALDERLVGILLAVV